MTASILRNPLSSASKAQVAGHKDLHVEFSLPTGASGGSGGVNTGTITGRYDETWALLKAWLQHLKPTSGEVESL